MDEKKPTPDTPPTSDTLDTPDTTPTSGDTNPGGTPTPNTTPTSDISPTPDTTPTSGDTDPGDTPKGVLDGDIFDEIDEDALLYIVRGKETPTPGEVPPPEGTAEENFTLRDYTVFARTVVYVIDGVAVLSFYLYARTQAPEVSFKEVKSIVGLTGDEKSEIARLLGRILQKYQYRLNEEVQLAIVLFRIYALSKMTAFSEYLSKKKASSTSIKSKKTSKKTAKSNKPKRTKKKSVKDVLEEAA